MIATHPWFKTRFIASLQCLFVAFFFQNGITFALTELYWVLDKQEVASGEVCYTSNSNAIASIKRCRGDNRVATTDVNR